MSSGTERSRSTVDMDGDVHDRSVEATSGKRPDFLDPVLWRRLSSAEGLAATAEVWCSILAGQISAAKTISVLAKDAGGGPLNRVASWPANRVTSADALVAADAAVENNRGVVRASGPGRSGSNDVSLATPLVLDGTCYGVAVLECPETDEEGVRAIMRQLQWGSAWLRDALRREVVAAERERLAAVGHALHVVVAAAEQEGFEAACRAASTDIAARFSCDRVSIGVKRLGRSRVRAISHTAQFGKRMNLVRMLNAAMDEAIDQRTVVIHPVPRENDSIASHAAQSLARVHGAGYVLTVPLYSVDRYIGAITLERPEGSPFDQNDAETLEAIATTLAPVIEEKRQNDAWLITKFLSVIAAQVQRLLGPGRVGRKLFVLSCLAIGAFFYVAKAEYRVPAEAVVEGSERRAIVAAYDGYVADAPARAGDRVEEGDLLVRLDDRDLALERLRLVTMRQRIVLEYEGAIAARDRAEARIKQTEIAQADAQIGLFDAQLERVRLTAPFDGVVVSGDLSQSVGAAVRRGEVLLEVAPLEAYRVVVQVDERQIADVEIGQTGTLLVSALPDELFPISVEKITPVAEYQDGQTTFRVEAALAADAARLRPGMEGVVKIDIEERHRIAIWTKPALDWARVWTWRWLEW